MDVIHLGDTLGLGGLFLRAGDEVFRPPLNMPDYAHKPSPPEVPQYRVIADGPGARGGGGPHGTLEDRRGRGGHPGLYSIAAGGTDGGVPLPHLAVEGHAAATKRARESGICRR